LLKEGALEAHNNKLQEKYRRMEKNDCRVETYRTEDADIVIVAYGSMTRIAKASIDRIREKGIKAGLVRPVTLWPFPLGEIARIAKGHARFLVVEMSAGQMVEDVRLAVGDDSRIFFYGRTGGGVPSEEEIMNEIEKII
jgi:2-oxoglutarate ferredoxin oxidoreductase subunit alpha